MVGYEEKSVNYRNGIYQSEVEEVNEFLVMYAILYLCSLIAILLNLEHIITTKYLTTKLD